MTGLDLSKQNLQELLSIDEEAWKQEMDDHESFFKLFGNRLPKELRSQLAKLRRRFSTWK